MYLKLSYDLTVDTVIPMEGFPLKLKRASSIEKGEISNTFYFEVNNHAGSHIDAPNHFYQNGKRIADFDISSFVFEKPLVIDVPKQDSELITSVDLEPFYSRISNCDLLLLRTGFSRYRNSQPLRYARKNPGLSGEAATFIKENCKGMRALAIDSISMAAAERLKEGIEAHRILLGDRHRPILLIEDINLKYDLAGLKRVIVLPLFIRGIDSSPCTVMAEIEKSPSS